MFVNYCNHRSKTNFRILSGAKNGLTMMFILLLTHLWVAKHVQIIKVIIFQYSLSFCKHLGKPTDNLTKSDKYAVNEVFYPEISIRIL